MLLDSNGLAEATQRPSKLSFSDKGRVIRVFQWKLPLFDFLLLLYLLYRQQVPGIFVACATFLANSTYWKLFRRFVLNSTRAQRVQWPVESGLGRLKMRLS